MYVTIKYRKRGGEREEGLKKLSASRMDKKERRRKERKKTRSANTRERERESKLWRRRWGPVGDEHIGGGRGRRRRRFARAVGKGGRSEVEKKIARRLFSCRNFYWRLRHVGPTGGGGGRGGGEGQEGGGGRGLAVAPGNAPAPASNRTWRGGGPRAAGRPSGAEGGAGLLQATGPLPPRRTPLLNVLRVSPRGGVTGITAFRGQNPTRTHGERSPLSI